MCDNDGNFNQSEIDEGKSLIKVASDYSDTIAEDFAKNAKETLGYDIDFNKAKNILKGKGFALDAVLGWDDNKAYDDNIAYIGGTVLQGAVLGGLAGVFGLAGLTAFGVGIAAGMTLDYLGLNLGDFTESLYKGIKCKMEEQDIENLSEEDRKKIAEIIKSGGYPWNYDPNYVRMADPLVLDTNKDGYISTIALEDSNAYFNIAGDEREERVGWIKSEDALLIYDKNEITPQRMNLHF